MTTLLIGATGQVGTELARQSAGRTIIATTRTGDGAVAGLPCIALDVTDTDAIGDVIRARPFDVVINASAYTAVDRAEAEPELAFRVNAEAPAAMASACREIGARFVHFSTDYVFDGSGSEPYRIDSPTAPLGVYGRSKREGETRILDVGADALILRTAWVYATRGQNFLRTMLRLARERDELRVVDDQVGSPTPAWLVARLAFELLDRAALSGIHHVACAGQVSWCGFANAIFEAAVSRGLLPRVPTVIPVPSSAYPTPAARPKFSVLDTQALLELGLQLPHWRAALGETLDREGDALAQLLG